MPYVNPIPAIDIGKDFEMRLAMHYDEPIPVEKAKTLVAKYLLEQTPETLASWLSCVKIKAMYPDDLTPEQRKKFGLLDKGRLAAHDDKKESEEDKTDG